MTDDTATGPARFAIYAAPESGSALHRFGSSWLGRDAASGDAMMQPAVAGMDQERLAALTRAPRGYGFHATLKAPFALGDGVTQQELAGAMQELAAERSSFAVRLRLARLHGFFALVLAEASDAMQALADSCVERFDRFRAPMSAQDRARRRPDRLDPRQRAYLDRWGYPYVFDCFTFHMTLTDRVTDDAEAALLARTLDPSVERVCAEPFVVDAIALFVQPRPDAAFHEAERFRFKG